MRDLAEALRLVPGVYVRTTIGKQGREAWMQGFSSDRVLVLVDGVPALATTGSTVDLTQIAVSDVERIEVYASDDAQAKFVSDFLAAWAKVMDLDRYDLA